MKHLLINLGVILAIVSAAGFIGVVSHPSNSFIPLIYQSATWLVVALVLSLSVVAIELGQSHAKRKNE